MLDQPVPNPVAKNPNIYTHKFFAAVGLALIGTIIATAGIWWYTQNQSSNNSDEVNITNQSKNMSTASANNSVSNIPEDLLSYDSWAFNYSIFYPKSWSVKSSIGNIDDFVTETVYLNKTESETRQNGKPNVTIFGNFEGDFCNGDPESSETSCTSETIIINNLEVRKLTSKTLDETYYIFPEKTGITIITASNGEKDLVEKVISTIKFK